MVLVDLVGRVCVYSSGVSLVRVGVLAGRGGAWYECNAAP